MRPLIIIPTVPKNYSILQKCLFSLFSTIKAEFDLCIITNNYAGYAVAVNRGLRCVNSEHDAIILLNDDIILLPDWYEKILAVAKNPAVGMIGDNNSTKDYFVAFYFAYIKKEVFDKVGFLDEQFKIGEWEDNDYGVRVLNAGYQLGKIAEPLCHHELTHTFKTISGFFQERQINKQKFIEKYKNTPYANV